MSASNGNGVAPTAERNVQRPTSNVQRSTHLPDIHREMPHSVEAEQGVLGSMLISREVIDECVSKVSLEHFFVPAHQTIYSALVEIAEKRAAFDLITFTQTLRDRNELDAVGGASFVTSLFTFIPTAANVGYYLEIVREKYILRQIIAIGTALVRQAYEEQDEINILLDLAQEKITSLALSQNWNDGTLRHIREGVMETLEKFDKAYHHRGDEVVDGLATGFHDVDRMLGGLKPQQFITIAGMTSQGKSVVAANIAEHVGHVCQVPVGIWSMEMSYNENIDRIVCSVSDTSLQRLRDGFLSEKDFPRITKAAGELAKAPIYIDDSRGLSIQEFKAAARRAVKRHGLKLIIIDYLQLMSSMTRRAQENRAREIAEITGGLKSIAKELQIPVIGLAQLSREADKRASVFRRPKLSDLKESSSIEQDSDAVLFIWRPGKFAETEEDREKLAKMLRIEQVNDEMTAAVRRQEEIDGETIHCTALDVDNYAELIVSKNRNGPVSKAFGVRLRFESDITRFQNTTPKNWSNNPAQRQK